VSKLIIKTRIKKPSTALTRAKNILITKGWTRGQLVGRGGSHCAVGAVGSALGVSDSELSGLYFHFTSGDKVFVESTNYLQEAAGVRGLGHLMEYNDSLRPSEKAKILALFDKAILAAKKDNR